MIGFFESQKIALRSVISVIRQRPAAFLVNIVSFALVLTLPFVGYIALFNLIAAKVDYEPKLAVYFKLDITETQMKDAIVLMKRLSGIKHIDVVHKADAMAHLKTNPELKAALEMLSDNPFPDAAFITPKNTHPHAVHTLQKELGTITGVELVELDTVWVRRLNAVINLGQSILITSIILLCATVVMIALTIGRIEVLRHIDEIELANLLGGNISAIQRPYVWFGFLLGCLGAIGAGLISFIGLVAVRPDALALAAEYGSTFKPTFIPLSQFLIFVIGGGLLGAAGGWAAIVFFKPSGR